MPRTPLALFLLFAATIAVFFPVYGAFFDTPNTDFSSVSRYAQKLGGGGKIISPHFLLPLLVVGVQKTLPFLSSLEATRVVGLLAQLACATALFVLFRQAIQFRRPATDYVAALLAFVALLLGPINLWTVPQQNLYAGYFNPTNFHNPSSHLLKPFAVVLFFAFTVSLGTGARRRWPWVIGLGSLNMLAMLVKPSFSIYFVPTLMIVAAAARIRKRPVDLRLIGLAYLLPFLLVATAQYLATYTPAHAGELQRYVTFDPFRVILNTTPALAIPVKLIASIAFPLTVLGTFFHQARRNRELLAAWLGFLVAAGYAYVLVEGVAGTTAWGAGNFWWSVQIATFLLFVASMRHVLIHSGATHRARPPARLRMRLWGCAIVLAGHLCGGTLWYLATLNQVSKLWR